MTTPLDHGLSIRGKLIAALKSDPQLNAIVPATRVYPSKVPADRAFPFIRLGTLTSAPVRADCGPGSTATGFIHCFVKLDAAGGIPDPEALAITINGHIARIVDDLEAIPLDADADLSVQITQTQVIEDLAEADAYHGLVAIEALAI